MADLFGTGIQLPNIPEGQARASDIPGVVRVYLKNGQWYGVDHLGNDAPINQPPSSTIMLVDGGNASSVFTEYQLRFDFGANGSSINPQGEP